MPVTLEHIGKRRDGIVRIIKQLLEGRFGHHKAVQGGIVSDRQLTVLGAADIELEAVGAMGECQLKGGNGVFGSVFACPAMS